LQGLPAFTSASRRWTQQAVFALLVLVAPQLSSAASDYGQGSGLPSVLVEALAFDENGYLWIGTQDGVVRFDSHRFLPIEIDPAHAVPDRHVREILAVPGAVYFATPSRLHRFDLASETLRNISFEQRDIGGVLGMRADRDGWLYIGTESHGVLRWRDAARGAPEVQHVALQSDTPLPAINELAIGRDALWLATMRGVYRVERGSWRAERVRLPLPAIDDGAVHVSAVHEANDGELWIGLWNDGLVRHDPRSGRTRWLRPGEADAGALRSTSIYSFLETPRGIHVGTNRGMVLHRADCDCLRGLNHPRWDAVEGSGYIVSDLVAEGDGVWAGIWGAGLVRFSPSDEVFEHQVRIDGRDDALAHPMVYALHVGASGRLWIGTYGGGVQWADAATRVPGRSWPLQRVEWDSRPVESRYIWSLDEDVDGVLIGAGRGLFRWRDGRRLEDVDGDLLSVRSVLRTRDGVELVGTMFGLFRAGPRGLQEIALHADAATPPPSKAVWSLDEHDGEIWVGTARGLARLSADLRPVAWHRAGADADQLPGAVVWTQKHDPQDRHWLGTSGGLVELRGTPDAPRFERHGLPAALGVHSIGSIEFDHAGQLWLGTPKGLVRYRPGTRRADLFDSHDGLVSDQLNSNASANDGERLYFGGIGGLVAFDPAALPERNVTLDPDVVKWRLGEGDWRPRVERISLAHEHEALQLEFSAHFFSRPERVRYAYRWSPLESGFTELGDARSAVFSRLPSGGHTLELRASLAGDAGPGVIASVLHVVVAMAWHETLWGRALIALAIFLLGYAVYFLRSRQSRLYAQGLAREVRERTGELTRAKVALETANAKLQQQVAIDPLTGLDNRRQVFDVATRCDAQGVALAAMLIDLDHFKRINDEHGHQLGDAVLVDFADLLRAVTHDAIVRARYGGEEFLCLFEDTDAIALRALAERLLQAVRARRVPDESGSPFGYGASIGLAVATPHEPAEALIRRADRALYLAKQQGRDGYAMD
jgi:diguanylate cyclase (GGDEF)-like protein